MKPGDGVFGSHAARKWESVSNRFLVRCVLPESGSAHCWPELGAMNGENSPISDGGVAAHHYFLVPHLRESFEELHLFVDPVSNLMIARREPLRSRSSESRKCPHKSR